MNLVSENKKKNKENIQRELKKEKLLSPKKKKS
jgi:hypothetical protein